MEPLKLVTDVIDNIEDEFHFSRKCSQVTIYKLIGMEMRMLK
jgi:hypothetical protein